MVLAFTMLMACKKESKDILISEGDYLIFGSFYGECIGEGCVETFKLTDSALYEDSNDQYGGTGPFEFILLDEAKFNLVRDLPEYMPSELLDQADQVFGCPDCADQGGLVVIYARNGKVRNWKIDQSKGSVPSFLHGFMDKLNEKISLINQ